jgi:hypothetical protein
VGQSRQVKIAGRNVYLEIEMRDRKSRRNAKHFGGKAKAHFRRSRQIKIAGRNFYLEIESRSLVHLFRQYFN